MPYSYHKEGDKYVVTKKDTGKEVGRTKGTKEALKKYLAALHINANEGKINEGTPEQEKIKKVVSNYINLRKAIDSPNYPDTPQTYSAMKKIENILQQMNRKADMHYSLMKILPSEYHDILIDKKNLSESKSNPVIDNLLKVINTKKAGLEYKKALMDLIAMAEKKSGKTVNTKKEALLALDYNESSIKESNTMKKSELTKMIQEVIKEVLSEQATNKEGWLVKSNEDDTKYIVVHTSKVDNKSNRISQIYKDKKLADKRVNDLNKKLRKSLTEAYVPDNIKKFAKRKGVSSLVNTVAGWAEKVGKRITGGTAIGKDYSTLILDMGYQTADIYIDTEEGTIELYGEPVRNFNEFKKVWLDQMTADEMEKDDNQFRRETGVDESADYDTAVAFRLVAKGNRDAALEALQAEINKVTGVSGRFSKVKATIIPSKGNPQDIIVKLNGPSAFSMGKDITAKDKAKVYTNPVIRNNFSKVSPYTPQLTKI